jgi:hypothetical protein
MYRAYAGWPGIYFFDRNTADQSDGTSQRIVIKKARLENDHFIIERVIPEGKKEMDFQDNSRGKKA